MTEQILIGIILIHYLGDFVLQTHSQSLAKSSSNRALAAHVGTYTAIWFYGSLLFLPLQSVLIFCLVTFIAHFATDYVTSRIAKKFFEEKDYHNGFVVVGFDQMLHYTQLYLTFKILL